MSENLETTVPPGTSGAEEASRPLSWVEKIGYAAGDFASCLYFGIFMSFLSYYYTEVFGISATAVGTMIFVTRTWDWINDPIMGMVADRTRTRMGKFRPWLLWVLPFWIVIGVLSFTDFDLSNTGRLVYAYVTYTLLTMAYTAINVPYSALMGVMTARSDERTMLASVRFVGAFAGTSVVNATMLLLVAKLGGGDEQLGFTLAVGVYAVLSGAAFLFTFFATKERVEPPVEQQVNLREELGTALKNGPWLVMIVVSVLTIMWISLRSGVTIHYFEYASGNKQWGGVFLTVSTLVQIGGVLLTKYFVRFLGGKKRAFLILTVGNGIFIGLFYFIDPTNFWLLMIHQGISSFCTGPMMPMFWSMIADTADYGQWKFRQRSTGLMFSTGTFSQKIGWSIGPATALWMLEAFGYVPKVDNQTPETVHGLQLIMSLIPAGFAFLAALMVSRYAITAEVEEEMQAAILADEQAIKSEGQG